MQHVMIDLEGLSTRPNPVILAIAAVYFDPKTGETGKRYDVAIEEGSCENAGLVIDESTVRWWLGQSKEAQNNVLNRTTVTLFEALKGLRDFLIAPEPVQIWANGPQSDGVWLLEAYRHNGQQPAFEHWQLRDVRTIKSLVPDGVHKCIDFRGVQHDPMFDCLHQVKQVHACFTYLRTDTAIVPEPKSMGGLEVETVPAVVPWAVIENGYYPLGPQIPEHCELALQYSPDGPFVGCTGDREDINWATVHAVQYREATVKTPVPAEIPLDIPDVKLELD